jgi:hypothetical protein
MNSKKKSDHVDFGNKESHQGDKEMAAKEKPEMFCYSALRPPRAQVAP